MVRATVEDLTDREVHGRRVFVRVDLNVPLGEDGRIADAGRIVAVLPTLEHLRRRGARLVLASHLGRPDGAPDPAYSLRPVAEDLERRLEQSVTFIEGGVEGERTREAVSALEDGGVALLENVRFAPGETKNDPTFARALADLGDHYVSDAFGAAHRAHASTVGAAEVVKQRGGRAVAGLLMARELHFLDEALRSPEPPFVAVMGGAKISGKIEVVDAILGQVDRLLVGGAMANTFFRALGLEVGRSLVEEDRVDFARDLLERAGEKIVLPVDCVVGYEIVRDTETRTRRRDEIGPNDRVGDVGPETLRMFTEEVHAAGTVVWNGPMGVFEVPPFDRGTREVALALAHATDAGTVSIVGGGDSAAAAEAAGVADRITHISTGGGASLELLAGKRLPGVEVLEPKAEGER